MKLIAAIAGILGFIGRRQAPGTNRSPTPCDRCFREQPARRPSLIQSTAALPDAGLDEVTGNFLPQEQARNTPAGIEEAGHGHDHGEGLPVDQSHCKSRLPASANTGCDHGSIARSRSRLR